jgi:hypothetical protein
MLPGGSLIFAENGDHDLYGSNVTQRSSFLSGTAQGSFIDLTSQLPAGSVLWFFVYIQNISLSQIDAQSRVIRLQIWRTANQRSFTYQLVFQMRAIVNVSGALYLVCITT